MAARNGRTALRCCLGPSAAKTHPFSFTSPHSEDCTNQEHLRRIRYDTSALEDHLSFISTRRRVVSICEPARSALIRGVGDLCITITAGGLHSCPDRCHFEATSTSLQAGTTIPSLSSPSTEACLSPQNAQRNSEIHLGIPLHALDTPFCVSNIGLETA